VVLPVLVLKLGDGERMTHSPSEAVCLCVLTFIPIDPYPDVQGHQGIVPMEPPPTFEEVMRQDLNSPLPQRPKSISVAPSSPRSPSIISLSSNDDKDGSHPGNDPEPGPAQISQWEQDLRAGFSLEERVKREWERRHAETIPVPILIPDRTAISVSQSPHQASCRSHEYPNTGADHSHYQLNDALAEESEWELVEREPLDVSAPKSKHEGSQSENRRQRPPPPPSLPRSYISVRDRISQFEGSVSSKPDGTNPIKRRRSPPPIPPSKPPKLLKPRGKEPESHTSAHDDSLPRSDIAFTEQGAITQVHVIPDTATNSSTILKDFDPLLAAAPTVPNPLSPEEHLAQDPPAGESSPLTTDEEVMLGPNRPLPVPPTSGGAPLSVITAFDELRQRQRRRAATIGSASSPPGSYSGHNSPSRSPSSASSTSPRRRDRRRHSILAVANPDPPGEDEEPQVSTADLLQRNHSLRRLPVVHDEFAEEVTELDIIASRLSMEGTARGDNYEAMLLIEEVLGPARPPPNTSTAVEYLSVGKVEVERRRVTRDGRTKLKLSLLGLPVERCSICFSQFKEDQQAAVMPNCTHCFHEKCIVGWVKRQANCPVCRSSVSPGA